MAIIYEQGRPYWQIAKRFNTHRYTSTSIGPAAVRDMMRLQQDSQSPAVLRRVHSFISANRHPQPGSGGNGDGPSVA